MRDDLLLARISVRLGHLKPLWLAHCRVRGINSSDAIRELISKELKAPMQIDIPEALRKSEEAVVFVKIRLGQQECSGARKLALAHGFQSVNRWIAALVRTRLSQKPQLGQAEIEALAKSNYQLVAIGRNLNQLVKEVRQFKADVKDYRFSAIEQLREQVERHTQAIARVLKSNVDRWR